MQNIIAAIFATESEGYQAMTQLRQNPVSDSAAISQMFLIKKDENGLKICDSFDTGLNTANDMVYGGLIGSLIGVLGGPIGMLLMGSYGVLAGSLADSMDAVTEDLMIETVANKMVDGEIALITLAAEDDEAYVDGMLSGFKVEIARFDAEAVAEEVAEAQRMEKEMAHLARVELRNARKAEGKKRIADMKEYVSGKLDDMSARISAADKRMCEKLDSMDDRIHGNLDKVDAGFVKADADLKEKFDRAGEIPKDIAADCAEMKKEFGLDD